MIPNAGQPNILSSPPGSSSGRYSYTDNYAYPRAQSVADFEVEHSPGTPSSRRRRSSISNYDAEAAYLESISALSNAKARPFSVSGCIPVDPTNLTLFFRSKVGLLFLRLGLTRLRDGSIEWDHAFIRLPYRYGV